MDLMTLKHAAIALNISGANLRQAIARGSLRAVKIDGGRDWFVTTEEVERYRRDNARTKTKK